MENVLKRWRPYIEEKEFEIMNVFFKNVCNKTPTGRLMIIKGPGKTGKTTFVSQVVDIIGARYISHISDKVDKDLIFVSEPAINSNIFSAKQIEDIKHKVDESKSLIMICNDIDIPKEIEKYCEIIEFKHLFDAN